MTKTNEPLAEEALQRNQDLVHAPLCVVAALKAQPGFDAPAFKREIESKIGDGQSDLLRSILKGLAG
jgi:hypothetical protein